ncbi:drongo, partial [Drosophila busckii]
MATFTQEEVDFLKAHGNESSAKTWLGLWDPKRAAPQQDQRELMIDKYERKRYYLEPASPLKSLTNAVNLKSYTSNGIHLTPPAAQRTAANGLHKTTPPQSNSNSNSNTVTASMAISRPQHSQHSTADAFNMPGLNLSSLNSAGSTSTGALSDTSSCASNGFAGESDFVADFGAANIFDATSARNAASPQSSSYEDEPIDTNSKTDTDTVTDTICQLSYNPFVTWPTAQQKQSQSSVKAPSEDRYAALKDLDEQLRELKASETVSTDLSAAQLNGNGNGNTDPFNYNNNTVNPFKSQQQQQQQQQQQPTQQPQLLNGSRQVVNPFQANNNQQQQQKNLYGQLTLIPNGYHHHQQQQQQQQEHQLGAGANFYNFNNNGFAVSQGLPNGCGFGSIMQPAPVMAGGMSGAYNNPFA